MLTSTLPLPGSCIETSNKGWVRHLRRLTWPILTPSEQPCRTMSRKVSLATRVTEDPTKVLSDSEPDWLNSKFEPKSGAVPSLRLPPGRSGNSRMKPKSRRYAGTRGLARPAAAVYLLYFRCRFDMYARFKGREARSKFNSEQGPQPRNLVSNAARLAVHIQQQTRFAATLLREPFAF